jgi:hypothetical protein
MGKRDMKSGPRWRTIATAGLLALTTSGVTPPATNAQTPRKCLAAKFRCVATKVQALLRCYENAERAGVDTATDPRTLQCVRKAQSRFDGGSVPATGCFERAEAKETESKPQTICLTADDTAAMEVKADVFVADVVADLDPGFGPSPRFEDTGPTIIDRATGLEWEKKTQDGSIHDLGDFYELSDSTDDDLTDPDGNTFTTFLAALNNCVSEGGSTVTGGFAGHCDWRLPQLDELVTILDLEAAGCAAGAPCIDPIFGPTAADGYWSATTAGNPTHGRGVNFEQGTLGFGEKDDDLLVRAVRGAR